MHPLLPLAEQRFQRHIIRFCQRPLFAIGVIHLQMMKIEGHREFVAAKRGILLAVFQRGRGHFAYRHQITRRKNVTVHFA
ncbi:Uncharacterised protein [Salmonella enterica subsp. enterica serovar Typhi]|nr:Uncharacterised protein [Salmonella enterica subsp. enterica serovar Typhi]